MYIFAGILMIEWFVSMGKLQIISNWCSKLGSTMASVARIVILSRCRVVKFSDLSGGEQLVVLGNGPSVNKLLAEYNEFLGHRKCLAVNFSLNSDIIFRLQPELYVLADPYFFSGRDDTRVCDLWRNLNRVSWNMTLFIPYGSELCGLLENKNISIQRYNLTPIEGFKCFTHRAFKMGLGMPRPRNVLIASIMLGVESGFKQIYLAGAEHSWLKDMIVDDDNRLGVAFPHFYDNGEKDVEVRYLNKTLVEELDSLRIAFNSYHEIRAYTDTLRGVQILNITPGSYIDAFERYSPERG
ncbi:MAG: hypothetical protein J1F10_00170 [Muribaculaceae bacterium]|nr:hypothetical protein [Muribaculaceae bacterium]